MTSSARRAVVGASLLVAIAAAGRARAAGGDPGSDAPRARLYVGLGGGEMLDLALTVDGHPATERVGTDAANVTLAVGVEGQVTRWLALGVEGRLGTWNSAWAQNAGYDQQDRHERNRLDTDAVMKLRAPSLSATWKLVTPFVAPSAGFTWPRPPGRHTRAVTETWHPQRGWNAGVDIGVERWFKPLGHLRPGLAVSIGYVQYWMALDGTFTPVDGAGPAVSQRFRYVTREILFKLTVFAAL